MTSGDQQPQVVQVRESTAGCVTRLVGRKQEPTSDEKSERPLKQGTLLRAPERGLRSRGSRSGAHWLSLAKRPTEQTGRSHCGRNSRDTDREDRKTRLSRHSDLELYVDSLRLVEQVPSKRPHYTENRYPC